MKKSIILLVAIALTLILSGCTTGNGSDIWVFILIGAVTAAVAAIVVAQVVKLSKHDITIRELNSKLSDLQRRLERIEAKLWHGEDRPDKKS